MKRLQVISDFTELGSGFKIAMKDMEIRGARGRVDGARPVRPAAPGGETVTASEGGRFLSIAEVAGRVLPAVVAGRPNAGKKVGDAGWAGCVIRGPRSATSPRACVQYHLRVPGARFVRSVPGLVTCGSLRSQYATLASRAA